MNREGGNRSLGIRREVARTDAGPAYVERRNEIIAAARGVFRSKGFHAATFKDVADAYGGDRATVYYYFKDKKELFREIVLEHIVTNVTKAEKIGRRRDMDSSEKLRWLIIDLMDSYERTYPDLFIYIQEDMGQLLTEQSDWADDIRDLQRRYDRTVERIIKEGVEHGLFADQQSPRIVTYAIVGMLNWSHRWYRPEIGSAREIGEGLADLILSGLAMREAET